MTDLRALNVLGNPWEACKKSTFD